MNLVTASALIGLFFIAVSLMPPSWGGFDLVIRATGILVWSVAMFVGLFVAPRR